MTDRGTVFIVDDDTAAAASVAALMSAARIPCEMFESAEAFLDSYDGSRAGCLILDVRLSGMNGFELHQTLQQRQLEIPTILVSGHADSDARLRALREGAIACLEKPYAGRELCALVRSVLKK